MTERKPSPNEPGRNEASRRASKGAANREVRGSGRGVRFLALVVLVALWPLAHRALVLRYQVDPWRLGGFAMYTTYQSTLVALFEATPGGLRVVEESGFSSRTAAALERMRLRRRALGQLAEPTEALRRVYAERPDLENLVVVIQRLWIDPETGRIASEKEILPYRRGEPFLAPAGGPGTP